MKALLTSSGIKNRSIHDALVELLGKPIEEATALVVPTAIYPFPGGAVMAANAIRGKASTPMAELGWKSLGILELTALPSIDESAWVPALRATDALLVWGGDPLFLAHWMHESGLARLLPTLADTVYVGVSAGSIATAATFVETYTHPPRGSVAPLASERIVFADGVERTLVTGRGVGLVDFAIIPHYQHPDHPDASTANAALWASRIPGPAYAIDDATALCVVDGQPPRVVTEGAWRAFP